MNLSLKSVFDKIKTKFQSMGKLKIVFILGVIGISLIILSEFSSNVKTDDPGNLESILSSDQIEKDEKKLCNILKSIDGVGNVEVMITYESGEEYVFATEDKKTSEKTSDEDSSRNKTQHKSDTESSIIIYDTDSGKKALIKKTLLPKVQGVVVICDGGNDIYIKEQIYDVVKTALNVNLNQICICQYNKN